MSMDTHKSTESFWQTVNDLHLKREQYDRLYAAAVAALQEQYGRGAKTLLADRLARGKEIQEATDRGVEYGRQLGRRDMLEKTYGTEYLKFFGLVEDTGDDRDDF